LWANLHLLFWLSLVPFATEWVGETHSAPLPTALYGVVQLGAAVAYVILQGSIVRHHGRDSGLALAVGRDRKGKLSLAGYVLAIPLAFVDRWISVAIFVIVAMMWFIPDRRIESRLEQ
jgi:uncharacterized membrane protein